MSRLLSASPGLGRGCGKSSNDCPEPAMRSSRGRGIGRRADGTGRCNGRATSKGSSPPFNSGGDGPTANTFVREREASVANVVVIGSDMKAFDAMIDPDPRRTPRPRAAPDQSGRDTGNKRQAICIVQLPLAGRLPRLLPLVKNQRLGAGRVPVFRGGRHPTGNNPLTGTPASRTSGASSLRINQSAANRSVCERPLRGKRSLSVRDMW